MAELSGDDQIFINKITEIILANLGNENFGVDELAHEAGMTTHSLRQRLHDITDKNIAQYIRETRLLKSLELLKNEKLTAAEVAYKTGFSSPAYFNTCFHEFFGYSPGEVKKGNFKVPVEEKQKLNNTKSSQPKSFLKRIVIASVSIVIFLILVFTGFYLLANEDSPDPEEKNSGDLKSIAVLPFKNLSDSDSNYYFIEGTMEEILTNLSKINDLRVISRTSVEQFRNSSLTVTSIGRKLKADYIVEASGQKIGSNFKLRVQLIDAVNDRHVWAETYEVEIREVNDIYEIQNQVAQTIARELNATITPEEKKLIERMGTANLTALNFCRRGTEEMRLLQHTSDMKHRDKSHEMFIKALSYDSTYAPAYLGLARIFQYFTPSINYYNDKYLDSLKILLDKALFYDSKLADAYALRGNYYLAWGNTEQALRNFSEALKYDKNNYDTYLNIGKFIYLNDRRHQDYIKAIENMEKAASLYDGNGLPVFLRSLGYAYGNNAGFKDIAIKNFKSALDLFQDTIYYNINLGQTEMGFANFEKAIEYFLKYYPEDTPVKEIRSSVANCYYLMGRYKDALKYTEEFAPFVKSNNRYDLNWKLIGSVYLVNGNKSEADFWFGKLEEDLIKNSTLERHYSLGRIDYYYDWASLYAYKGDKEKTYESLENLLKAKVFPLALVNRIKNDALFNFISQETRYIKIIKEIESKYTTEHERVRKWLEDKGQL